MPASRLNTFSAFRILVEFTQEFAKVTDVLFGTFDRPVFIINSLKFFFAWEKLFHCQVCASTGFFKYNCCLKINILSAFTVTQMLIRNVVRFPNINKLDLIFIIMSIRPVHDEIPDATF